MSLVNCRLPPSPRPASRRRRAVSLGAFEWVLLAWITGLMLLLLGGLAWGLLDARVLRGVVLWLVNQY